jgi:hypothetical protein
MKKKPIMYDPFEPHPEMTAHPKKPKNILTLDNINAIIDIEIKAVENFPSNVWGFTREDILEVLEDLREKIVENAKNDQ